MNSLSIAAPPVTSAARRALSNWQRNLTALAQTQPELAEIFHQPPDVQWVFARDGSLTARDETGRWQGGCSLPLRAGKAMFKKLELNGIVGCMLAPTHPQQVIAALKQLAPQQAIILVQPDAAQSQFLFACADLAEAILHHRFWLAMGETWPGMLRDIFQQNPGLVTPSQFIRPPAVPDEAIQPLVKTAEPIFSEINQTRADQIAALSWCPTEKALLIAESRFRLWDNAGAALIELFGSAGEVHHLDPDDPAQSSALGLAQAASTSQTLLIANRVRAQLPAILPPGIQVISWFTQPHMPSCDPRFPHDRLLLADQDWLPIARSAGWPAERIALAPWPIAADLPLPTSESLALIADTFSLETPIAELPLSSHHVLWESIRSEILANPFALTPDPVAFIERHRKQLDIAEDGFNREFFLHRLAIPAYQQAITTILLKAALPVRLYGKGWDAFPNQGPVTTREDFLKAASATALVYPWPVRHQHEMDALGRPVLEPQKNEADLIRAARRTLRR